MSDRSPEQELAYIRRIMADSRRTLDENGMWQVVWSGVTMTGIALHYLISYLHIRISPTWLWTALMAAGCAWSLVHGARERRRKRHSTFAARLLRDVWVACGVGFAVIGFVASQRIPYTVLPALFCIVAAIGTFLTSRISGYRLILWTSMAWWLASVLMLVFPNHFNLLWIAGLMGVLMLAPGLYIHRSARAGSRAKT